MAVKERGEGGGKRGVAEREEERDKRRVGGQRGVEGEKGSG